MRDRTPWPRSPEDSNKVFNDMAHSCGEAFAFANALGIKTCHGHGADAHIPTPLKARLKEQQGPADQGRSGALRGMFTRIARTTCRLLLVLTHEGWTLSGVSDAEVAARQDLEAAVAARNVKAPFTLAPCGGARAAQRSGAIRQGAAQRDALSCHQRNVGFEFVERGFEQ